MTLYICNLCGFEEDYEEEHEEEQEMDCPFCRNGQMIKQQELKK